ncbi:D-sedoheptulose-7-phosphate isomerase [Tenggerimyces flavus]|uniref:SIS domain-containing protein n=1 Tax=Tenggerimyces flavus TaxID=1708749 RepID=A0ABV7YMH4_9ACTN|nr:SIS domain-containing protein [Tenggerimyces flavus]MBM7789580.1 D-sedoheptulose 7-phosphate isomerase [Tenggerimyces flavus]
MTGRLGILQSPACSELVDVLRQAREHGRAVLVAGNGGSAATAQHLAADWGRRAGVRAFDLCGCVPLLTAIGNDDGFERTFAEPIERLARPQDIVVLITTSGESPNLLAAARSCRTVRGFLVALTGRKDSSLAELADLTICVGSDVPEVAEDVHLSVGHAVVRQLLADRERGQVAATARPVEPSRLPVTTAPNPL